MLIPGHPGRHPEWPDFRCKSAGDFGGFLGHPALEGGPWNPRAASLPDARASQPLEGSDHARQRREVARSRGRRVGCSWLPKQQAEFFNRTEVTHGRHDSSDIAAWLQIQDENLTKEHALAVSYTRFVAPHIAQVDRHLKHILEISLRLSARGELLAAQRGLTAVHNVISRHFQLRRESSVAYPAAPFWGVMESDSSNVLARNYERVNAAGERLMAQRQSQSVVFIMDLYAFLVDDAKEVRFINKPGENPILAQLRANFSGLLDAAIRANDLEVCFRSINVSKVIGAAAVEHEVHATTMTCVFEDLAKVATWAVASKNPVFVGYCTGPIVALLVKAIEEGTPGVDYQTGSAFKHLQSITLLMHNAMSTGLISGVSLEPGIGYAQLELALPTLIQRFDSHVEGQEKRLFAHNLSNLFEEMYDSLRELAETVRNCDAPLILNVATLMDDTLKHLVHLSQSADKQKNLQRRDTFEKHLSWFTTGSFTTHQRLRLPTPSTR